MKNLATRLVAALFAGALCVVGLASAVDTTAGTNGGGLSPLPFLPDPCSSTPTPPPACP